MSHTYAEPPADRLACRPSVPFRLGAHVAQRERRLEPSARRRVEMSPGLGQVRRPGGPVSVPGAHARVVTRLDDPAEELTLPEDGQRGEALVEAEDTDADHREDAFPASTAVELVVLLADADVQGLARDRHRVDHTQLVETGGGRAIMTSSTALRRPERVDERVGTQRPDGRVRLGRRDVQTTERRAEEVRDTGERRRRGRRANRRRDR